jgi:hypothetical protein
MKILFRPTLQERVHFNDTDLVRYLREKYCVCTQNSFKSEFHEVKNKRIKHQCFEISSGLKKLPLWTEPAIEIFLFENT